MLPVSVFSLSELATGKKLWTYETAIIIDQTSTYSSQLLFQSTNVSFFCAMTMKIAGAVEFSGRDLMKWPQPDWAWGRYFPWYAAATVRLMAMTKSTMPKKTKIGPEAMAVGIHIVKFHANPKTP